MVSRGEASREVCACDGVAVTTRSTVSIHERAVWVQDLCKTSSGHFFEAGRSCPP